MVQIVSLHHGQPKGPIVIIFLATKSLWPTLYLTIVVTLLSTVSVPLTIYKLIFYDLKENLTLTLD